MNVITEQPKMGGSGKTIGLIVAVGVVLFAATVVWVLPDSGDSADLSSVVDRSIDEENEDSTIVSQVSDELPDDEVEALEVDIPEPVVEEVAQEPVEEAKQELTPGSNSQLDALLESEPVDPDWAPRVEATLDGVIAASGLLAYTEAEVELQCRTSICRAHVVHLEGYDRDAFKAILEDELRPLMTDVIRSEYPRVQQFVASTRHPSALSELPGNRPQTTIYLYKSMPIPLGPSSPDFE